MVSNSIIKRFVFPLLFVIVFKLLVGAVYDAASTLESGIIRVILIQIFGPLTFFSLWFFAFVGPAVAYFLGARFWERLVIAFANPVIWITSVEAKTACQYTLVEMVYFFFLPWTFGIMCVTCVEFSLTEFICRWVHSRKSTDVVRVLHPGISAMFILGGVGMYFGLIRGQEWVYIVVHHFKSNFL